MGWGRPSRHEEPICEGNSDARFDWPTHAMLKCHYTKECRTSSDNMHELWSVSDNVARQIPEAPMLWMDSCCVLTFGRFRASGAECLISESGADRRHFVS